MRTISLSTNDGIRTISLGKSVGGMRSISWSKNIVSLNEKFYLSQRTNSLSKNVVSMRTNSLRKNFGGMRTNTLSKIFCGIRTNSLSKNCRRKVGNSVLTTTPLNLSSGIGGESTKVVRARGRNEAVIWKTLGQKSSDIVPLNVAILSEPM